MRKSYSTQLQFDSVAISDIQLNLNCRDEIIPILRGLQDVFKQPELRDKILQLIAGDVNAETRDDVGCEGFDYWQILVMTIVRHGCNYDYDKLQDLCEQHCTLRHMLGVGDWNKKISFQWRRIQDNLALVKPSTIEKISHLIVARGHELVPQAMEKVRADSFVVETNIHYPTESSLIKDGLRKVIPVMQELAQSLGLRGWRQSDYLLSQSKSLDRTINRIASKKGKGYKKKLKKQYKKLLRIARTVVQRIDEQAVLMTGKTREGDPPRLAYASVLLYVRRLQRVISTAHRRIILGESVPNSEKIFSIYEPHTQLYRRGKAGQDVQFGRLVLVYEDAAGFIVHHHLMDREDQDRDVAIEQSRILQERLQGRMQSLSLDRGFHSPENQKELSEIVDHVCLPKPGKKQAAVQEEMEAEAFHTARQHHSGVESAIGALQTGNGMKRCRDHGEDNFKRYVAAGILARNFQVLGKILIAQEAAMSQAAWSLRRPIAA